MKDTLSHGRDKSIQGALDRQYKPPKKGESGSNVPSESDTPKNKFK
ncbi:MAG: hypothetical protein K0U24_05740 [Gammaproteobacteria bacterium]|nr:hypothetical protein [Gammaproteobacteria bacterium]MCH9763709.1 hypothetical protein [Gammaproteobacteria bacterium]